MKANISVVLFYALVLAPLSLIAQDEILNQNNIQNWISKRRPLFITGISKLNTYGNNVPALFSAIAPSAKNYEVRNINSLKTQSAVALIHQEEILMAPIGLRIAIYPITIFNDSVVVCTRNPKPGNRYYEINSYELNDFVLFTKNAIELNEISGHPYEMSTNYIDRLYYSIRNLIETQNTGMFEVKCFVSAFLDRYKWLDEFLKQDYINQYTIDYKSYQPVLTSMTRPSNLSTLYVEYLVKLNEYSFEQSAFPISLGEIVGISAGLEGFSHDIQYTLNDKIIDIDKPLFNKGSAGFDEYRFIEQFIDDENDDDFFGYEKYMLPIAKDEARAIASSLNEDRTIRLRIILEPSGSQAPQRNSFCGDRGDDLERIPFVIQSYKFIQATPR